MKNDSNERICSGHGSTERSNLCSLAVEGEIKKNNSVTRNWVLAIWLFISFLYAILKMYRNSLVGASGSSGGIWNVLNISFIALSVLLLMSCIKKSITLPIVIKDAFMYSFYVAVISLLNLKNFSINIVFSYAMLFYFASVIFVFYYAASKGISKFEYKVYSVLYFALAAFTLFLMYSRVALNHTNVYQSDAYFLLCALPLVFLFDKKTNMYIKLIPLVVCLMMAGKRAGFIAMVCAVFVYYIIGSIQKKNIEDFFKVLIKLFVVAVFLFIAYFLLESKLNLSLFDRMETITTDGGSGRDDIYSGVWKAITVSDFYGFFFGHGLSGIQLVYGSESGAHNDFLEIMYNYGVFALILIINLYAKMFIACRKMIKTGYPGAKAAGASLIISIVLSLFTNYFITFTHITITATFWGIVIADWKHYMLNKSLIR